jgi:hypothetical protein
MALTAGIRGPGGIAPGKRHSDNVVATERQFLSGYGRVSCLLALATENIVGDFVVPDMDFSGSLASPFAGPGPVKLSGSPSSPDRDHQCDTCRTGNKKRFHLCHLLLNPQKKSQIDSSRMKNVANFPPTVCEFKGEITLSF